jgi:hypothetical protein
MSATEAKTTETASTTPNGGTATPDAGARADPNSASGLIEAPLKRGGNKLKQHDFPDAGGSGGAEAFRRKPS